MFSTHTLIYFETMSYVEVKYMNYINIIESLIDYITVPNPDYQEEVYNV
mgnify:CR=1 FL=1